FGSRHRVFRWQAAVGLAPLGPAELGFGFLQRVGGRELAVAGRLHVGLGLAERPKRPVLLAAGLPVEAVGPLDDAPARGLFLGGGSRGIGLRIGSLGLAHHDLMLRPKSPPWCKIAARSTSLRFRRWCFSIPAS